MQSKSAEIKTKSHGGIEILNAIYIAVRLAREAVLRGEDQEIHASVAVQMIVDDVPPEMLAEAIKNRGRDWDDDADEWLRDAVPEGVA